jgi:hypothetical protein
VGVGVLSVETLYTPRLTDSAVGDEMYQIIAASLLIPILIPSVGVAEPIGGGAKRMDRIEGT